MTIFLWILAVLIGVPVLLAVTPVRYRASVSVGGGTRVRATVSYMLHLFHMTIVHEAGETEITVRLAGINVTHEAKRGDSARDKKERKIKSKKKTGKKKTEKAGKTSEPKKEKEPFKLTVRDVTAVLTHPDLKTIIGLIWDLIKKVFKYILPARFNVTGTVGFDDPFNTGILIGAVSGFTHALNKHRHIMLTGDFDKPRVNLDIFVSGKLSAAGVLAPVVGFLLRKPIFKLIIEYIKKNGKNKKGDDSVRSSV